MSMGMSLPHPLTEMVDKKLRATAVVVEDRGDFMALLRGTHEGTRRGGTGEESRIVDYIVPCSLMEARYEAVVFPSNSVARRPPVISLLLLDASCGTGRPN